MNHEYINTVTQCGEFNSHSPSLSSQASAEEKKQV